LKKAVTVLTDALQEVKNELKEKYGIEDAWPVVSWYLRV